MTNVNIHTYKNIYIFTFKIALGAHNFIHKIELSKIICHKTLNS